MIAQILILVLMAIAARVTAGHAVHADMWAWTVAYWAVLTLKNGADWIASRKRRRGK